MGVFDALPLEPQPPPVRETFPPPAWPSWASRPTGVFGAFVPASPRPVSTPDAVVIIDGLMAYPEGFEFTLSAWAPDDTVSLPPFPHWYRDRATAEWPPGVVRVGVAFADGRMASNLIEDIDESVRSGGAVLRRAGESTRLSKVQYWVGPLPPPGAVTLFVEWPAHGMVETAIELDGDAIRHAAARADVVWE